VRNNSIVSGILIATCIIIGAISMTAYSQEPMTHVVEIKQLRFSSEVVLVKPGDTVTWINHDLVPHNVAARDKSWQTGTINRGESRSIIVTQVFELRYVCLFHPSMQAQLEM